MNIQDALKVLGFNAGHVTSKDIKQAYRKAAQKYHPDRSPASLEMMQLVNAAYDVLRDVENGVEAKGDNHDYGDLVNAALNAIMGLGLTIEICGAWVWLTGNTKPHKEVLKSAGFMWAPKKMQWYFRPDDFKSRNHKAWSMDEIRNRYGSDIIKNDQKILNAL